MSSELHAPRYRISDVDLDKEEVYVDGRRLTEAEVNAAAEELERQAQESSDGTHRPPR